MLFVASLLSALCTDTATPRFSGGLFGVRADVQLDLTTRLAHVRLRGAPLGGRLEGTAYFDNEGAIVIDHALKASLRRRAVHVQRCGGAARPRSILITETRLKMRQ